MRSSFKSACAVLFVSLACESGCGSRSANDAPAPPQVASGTESGFITREASRKVPPGAAGDFSFNAPQEGMTTLVVEGDCDKSVLLVSHQWAAAAERINAIPGLTQATERDDGTEVRRLINQHFSPESPVLSTYFTEANVNVQFQAPVGRIERKLYLLKGSHTLAISNLSEKPATISVSFKPAD